MADKRKYSQPDIVTAALLVIGDEILSGHTKDENVGYIAGYLTNIGIQLKEVRLVADDEAHIVEAVNALRARYSYLFTTGGIGPTHDDITATAIAKAFGVRIAAADGAVAATGPEHEPRSPPHAGPVTACIPQGAELVHDSISSAPGFMLENVIVMAGVPGIMQIMLDDVAPRLKTARKLLTRAVRVSAAEGDVAPGLARLQQEFPDVQIGSYPFFEDGTLGTQVVLRSTDAAGLRAAYDRLWKLFEAEGFADCATDIVEPDGG